MAASPKLRLERCESSRTNSSFGFKWNLMWGKLALEYVYLI